MSYKRCWVRAHGYSNDILKGEFTKIKKQSLSRKLIASFREALSNVVINLILSSVHVGPNFVTTLNCFSTLKQKLIRSLITFFSSLGGIIV